MKMNLFISSISPEEINPEEAPHTLVVRGSGFSADTRVRLCYIHEDILKADLDPVIVKEGELNVVIGKQWFISMNQVASRPTVKTFSRRGTAGSFSIQLLDSQGRASNIETVQFKNSPFRIKSTLTSPYIRVNPGDKFDLDISIERRKWGKDIQLKTIAFPGSISQPGSAKLEAKSIKPVNLFDGETVILARNNNGKLSVRVKADAPVGIYHLIVYSPITSLSMPMSKILEQLPSFDLHMPPVTVVIYPRPPLHIPYLDFPAAPSNLTIEQGETSFKLKWMDNSDNEDGFLLQMRKEDEQTWKTIQQFRPNSGTGLMETVVDWLSDTGVMRLNFGQTYYFRVGVYTRNFGPFPSEEIHKKFEPTQPPPAKPNNLEAVNIGTTKVTLRWQETSQNTYLFTIFRKPGPWDPPTEYFPIGYVLFTTGQDWFTWTDSIVKLEPDTKYEYLVVARNAGGVAYETISVKTLPLPPPIAPDSLTIPWITPKSIYLKWNDRSTDEDSFKVERRTPPSKEWTTVIILVANTAEWVDTKAITPDTEYRYRVAAYNVHGTSYSDEVSCHTPSEAHEIQLYGPPWVEPSFYPPPDTPFIVKATIYVFGNSPTGSFTSTFTLDGQITECKCNSITPDPYTGDCYAQIACVYPKGVKSGRHLVEVQLDSKNDVKEVYENDNYGSAEFDSW